MAGTCRQRLREARPRCRYGSGCRDGRRRPRGRRFRGECDRSGGLCRRQGSRGGGAAAAAAGDREELAAPSEDTSPAQSKDGPAAAVTAAAEDEAILSILRHARRPVAVLEVLGSGDMTPRQILSILRHGRRAVAWRPGVPRQRRDGSKALSIHLPFLRRSAYRQRERKIHLFGKMVLWTFANPTELQGCKDTSSHS